MRLILFAALATFGTAVADEPPKATTYELVTPLNEGITATALNDRGDVVGFHWEPENGNPDILYEAPFFARGKTMTRLPLLKGYTATFPAAVSDDGLVVGRVAKPAPPGVRVHLRNQAFIWDAETGIQGLGAPEGYASSFATGVSRDGRRISGFLLGQPRLQACLWERADDGDGDDDGWRAVILPEADDLGSNVVAISPDGKRLAAVQSSLPSLWTETEPGVWKRETLSTDPGSLIPRGVNNAGMVVGLRENGQGYTNAMMWTREGGLKPIRAPEGFAGARAEGVNNAGAVVGVIDGPHGSEIGPKAFVYENGRLRTLDECGPDFVWATAINDKGQVAGVVETEEAEVEAKPEGEPKP